MRLIGLAVVLALSLTLSPFAVHAQPAGKTARIGSLVFGPSPNPEELRLMSTSPLWRAMKDLGWVYGQNIVVERRFGESADQLRAGAADLVGLKVDVLFAPSAGLAELLQLETETIPIVVVGAGSDLVAAGLVASLARPGGNLTGVQVLNSDLIPKKLELLQAFIPNLSRIAFLTEDVSVLPQTYVEHDRSLTAAARPLGLNVHTVVVHEPGEFAAAFLRITKNRNQGLLVLGSPFSIQHRKQIVELAGKHRIVAIYENETFVEAGGLMSYAANLEERFRRGAVLVDKILRGAKPADLPVEQPTKFSLVINLKTAKALGLTIPQSLLLRADHVIQ
jgi:putative tryptophan/tyrosine transport system substrate-binding protein